MDSGTDPVSLPLWPPQIKQPNGAPLTVRVGLHTGPAVSGLSGGTKLPKFSVFGE